MVPYYTFVWNEDQLLANAVHRAREQSKALVAALLLRVQRIEEKTVENWGGDGSAFQQHLRLTVPITLLDRYTELVCAQIRNLLAPDFDDALTDVTVRGDADMDLPPEAGHRCYAATVDGSGRV
jgi:hypothetical protein